MTSPTRMLLPVVACAAVVGYWGTGSARADDVPEVPRIDGVVMSSSQPHESDRAVVWYDDFDGPKKPYTESQGGLDESEAFGGQARLAQSTI